MCPQLKRGSYLAARKLLAFFFGKKIITFKNRLDFLALIHLSWHHLSWHTKGLLTRRNYILRDEYIRNVCHLSWNRMVRETSAFFLFSFAFSSRRTTPCRPKGCEIILGMNVEFPMGILISEINWLEMHDLKSTQGSFPCKFPTFWQKENLFSFLNRNFT